MFKVSNSKNIFKRGFTLIELLVVISIIGVLSALLLSNMQDARGRARDTQRKSDLKQIQKALEMYKQDLNTYPATSGWQSALSPAYMNAQPQDPLNSDTYIYTYTLNGSDKYKYTLIACLENASDVSADNPINPGGSSCTKASYTLTEP